MKPDMAPSLVAMTPTQTPIIGANKRYISVREAASLQALDELKQFPENNERAFRALGNAVNARIVYEVAQAALR
jgi:DNA (cytosine-5)-methyltransferase 1